MFARAMPYARRLFLVTNKAIAHKALFPWRVITASDIRIWHTLLSCFVSDLFFPCYQLFFLLYIEADYDGGRAVYGTTSTTDAYLFFSIDVTCSSIALQTLLRVDHLCQHGNAERERKYCI